MFGIGQAIGLETGNLHCHIEKVDNGYIVKLERPLGPPVDPIERTFKTMVQVLPEINKLGAKAAIQGIDEGVDSWKEKSEEREQKSIKDKEQVNKAIEDTFKKPDIEKKPVEIHVFLNLVLALEFIKKVMG